MNLFDSLNSEWKNQLISYLADDYFDKMEKFMREEYAEKTIFPPRKNIFSAFDFFSPSQTKIVILGQDPYHGKGQAHGLAFSVQDGIKPPPSLKNIFKAINSDLGIEMDATSGNLTSWAEQGVLLMNAVMSVEEGAAASHRGKGWEEFTTAVVKMLSDREQNIVYILWGKDAWSMEKIIDSSKNLVLKSVHPSPLSAYRGFFDARHFSQANSYLKNHGKEEVDFRNSVKNLFNTI
ncbi:MAG: uracil-DNA glycosylase [Rikenellaceae bacterium]